MKIIDKTALDHSAKLYNKGFVKRVIDGDGRIFLKSGYKFEIELAFQIDVILHKAFEKSFKYFIEDSRINSIWDWIFRCNWRV